MLLIKMIVMLQHLFSV